MNKDMSKAPLNRQILVLARWDWEKVNPEARYGWRVCEWYPNATYNYDGEFEGAWVSETSNPYCDYGTDAQAWAEIPKE